MRHHQVRAPIDPVLPVTRSAMRPRTPARWGRALVLALAAVTVAGASGCSSSSSSSSSSPGGPSSRVSGPSESGTSTGTAGGAADDKAVLSYVGGKAGPADTSLSPVTIGYVNQQGGPVALPLSTYGADAAVKYINTELGGIDGHPLKLSACYVLSEESEGQKCGQQFANDPKIHVILMGALLTGNASFYKTLNAQKPIIGSVSSNPVDAKAKNTYFLYGTNIQAYGSLATYAKSKGYKSIVLVTNNSPAGQFSLTIMKQQFGAAGIDVRSALYPVGSSSLVGPMVAAKVKQADALLVIGAATDCIQVGKAIKQLNLTDKPTLSTPTCIDPSVKNTFGDLPQWHYVVSVNSFDTADPQVALFLKKFKKYEGDKASGGYAPNSFATVLAIAKLLNEAGGASASSQAIAREVKAFHGPVFLGPKKLSCGGYAPAPSSCVSSERIQTYEGNGKWSTDGVYSAPSK